jgi:uncharacterized membrane protein SpoIIM required for sporulation
MVRIGLLLYIYGRSAGGVESLVGACRKVTTDVRKSMREVAFLKQKADRWREFESLLAERKRADPDLLADLFVELTDDLSYARTFYPDSKTTQYLNQLTTVVHQKIYRNKKENLGRIASFWKYELPFLFRKHHRTLLYSFIIFTLATLIGAISAANDDTFVRLILSDDYVNMTLRNIEKGDPMGVYKSMGEVDMFFGITFNNIMVSFRTFGAGIFLSVGTAYMLFQNGVMLGSFQYFFYQKGLFLQSALAVWTHGTLEISAIIIAGCAGLVMGNSILFPGTYTRTQSFMRGAREGLKIVIGLVPIFIAAGFLESFVTRHTEVPAFMSLAIILVSLAIIIGYFVIYPIQLHRAAENNGSSTGHPLS